MPLIRSYQQGDHQAILEIYAPFVRHSAVTFETEVPTAGEFATRLAGISEKFPCYVLVEEQEILGYAYAAAHRERAAYRWCVETSIYMKETARGKGYGKVLYGCLLQELTQRGFVVAYALITSPNEGSVALHQSCGFQHLTLHRFAGFKQGGWHDVLWMEKLLAPASNPPQEPVFGNQPDF